jgi:monofunctional biosynthetic peptidoglycan transglycosylase
MTTFFFRNPKLPLPHSWKTLQPGRAAARKAGRHIALPVMGVGGWIVFLLRRLPLSVLGSALAFHLAVILFSLGAGIVFSWMNPPVTSLMLERLLDDRFIPRPPAFVPLEKIPAYVPPMFVRLEDKNFYRHHGVDPAAIVYAYTQNKRWGRVIMGGSTITQQTVRSLFLSPDKNYLRKYMEAWAAVALEAVVNKRRIFELYLNYIEWGKGVYGFGAAAEYYFKKPAARLNYEECARLAAIIINPIDFNVNDFQDQPAMAARYYALIEPPPAEPDETAPDQSAPEERPGDEGDNPPGDILP